MIPKNPKNPKNSKKPKQKAAGSNRSAGYGAGTQDTQDSTIGGHDGGLLAPSNAKEVPKTDGATMARSQFPKIQLKPHYQREPENKNRQLMNNVSYLKLNNNDQEGHLAAYASNPEFSEILKNPKTPFEKDGCFL